METLHKVVQTSVYLIKHSDILLAAYMSTVKYEVNIGMEQQWDPAFVGPYTFPNVRQGQGC